ncbi:MAG TPA: hypothetical protein VHC91_05465 [Trinickia sp.]|uniref:hypothetical protein n=1 Tax=Trinickia sp. TaxID=2571163 RepID=UPI002CA347C5|nr:hypothetical protein [Trinickia sp.]HVW49840.1 hypothetical protein [Trinickia sp.]
MHRRSSIHVSPRNTGAVDAMACVKSIMGRNKQIACIGLPQVAYRGAHYKRQQPRPIPACQKIRRFHRNEARRIRASLIPEPQRKSSITFDLGSRFKSAIRAVKVAFKPDTTGRDTRIKIAACSRGPNTAADPTIALSRNDLADFVKGGGTRTVFAYLYNRQAQHKAHINGGGNSPPPVKVSGERGKTTELAKLDLTKMALPVNVDEIFEKYSVT